MASFCCVEDGLQRRERGVQAEVAVQIDGAIFLRQTNSAGTRNRNRGAHGVVARVAVRDHDVQAVGGTALEDRDQNFLALRGSVLRIQSALQPDGSGADTDHRQAGILEEDAS